MALGISDAVELTRTIAELVKKGITLELQERITELREAVLNAKDEVLSLREQNQALRGRVAEQEGWEARAAKYTLITAPGGAHVYRTEGPPEHFACPRCFEGRKIHILQDKHTISGTFECPECGKGYSVNTRRSLPPMSMNPGPWSG
jgi:hypothetical protein